MASPQHVTLVANTVTTIILDDYDEVEVLNVDGTAAVYFTTGGTTPTVAGNGCDVVPAAISALKVFAARTLGSGVTVKLISTGTPKVSVRGL